MPAALHRARGGMPQHGPKVRGLQNHPAFAWMPALVVQVAARLCKHAQPTVIEPFLEARAQPKRASAHGDEVKPRNTQGAQDNFADRTCA